MKYSSFKVEDPLPLEDWILSDGPDSSCIYKSKYDVATYRGNAPHLSHGEKVDLIKNEFVPRSFKYEWLLLFPGFDILPVRMHLTSCLVFCLVMISLQKLIGLEIYFHSPSELDQVLFFFLKAIVKAKEKKIDPSYESVQSLHFSTWPKLEVIFYQIKGSSHEINLLCDRKYKHEVEKNRKILVSIIDTIVTL